MRSRTRSWRPAIPPLAAKHVVVMGGFIGATEDGVTTTLGRGGSDYTASIVGAGIGAEEIQIWTDVDGMLTADPTILAWRLSRRDLFVRGSGGVGLFRREGAASGDGAAGDREEYSRADFKFAAAGRGGDVDCRRGSARARAPIRSIACKKNITLVNIVSTRMLMAHGFLRRIFEIFDRFETPVDMLATSEVSVSLTIDNTRALEAIRAEIEEFAEVTVEENTPSCAWWARISGRSRAQRRGCSRRWRTSTCEWFRKARRC